MATEQRLIDAEWLKTRFYAICDFYDIEFIHIDRIIDEIDNAPEGVLEHGRWVQDGIYNCCSACNKLTMMPHLKGLPQFNYCPNCGALMDGGAENGMG